MLRTFILLASLLVHSANAQPVRDNWFVIQPDQKTYDVIGQSIHPAALFEKLSFHSGVEIRYEKELHQGLHLNMQGITLDELFDYVDSEFSTMKTYSKDAQGNELLIGLTILPKGGQPSAELVLAYDPVRAAIAHEKGRMTEHAEQVYVTRMEKLELKVRQQLKKMSQQEIKHQQKMAEKKEARVSKHERDKASLVSELKRLKHESPDLYQHKLAVHSWRYADLELAVNRTQ